VLTAHMPCYTHKMEIISWPWILWRHFTLCIDTATILCGTWSMKPSGCLSVHPVIWLQYLLLQRVCCCVYGGQEISLACCMVGAQQQMWGVKLQGDVGSWTHTCLGSINCECEQCWPINILMWEQNAILGSETINHNNTIVHITLSIV